MTRSVGLIVALGLAVGTVGTSTFGANVESSTLAFLITDADVGLLYGNLEEECPKGFEMTSEESYLASLTPTEREWMLRPENSFEYGHAWKRDYLTGPGGTNVCSNPKSFRNDPRRRPYQTVTSKVAYGLNLDGTTDGRATPKTCAHEKFQGKNGEPLVDNQFYRVTGCSKLVRGTERQGRGIGKIIVEFRGVDDLKNDDRVEVGIYSLLTDEVSLRSSDGSDVSHQTFTITDNPRWRAQTTARIVDGVLMSESIPVVRVGRGAPGAGRSYYEPNSPNFVRAIESEYRDLRLRVTVSPEGMKGVMGNYRPIDNIHLAHYGGGLGTAGTANHDCAAEYNMLAKFADGYPDPATGECTAISAAQNVIGIPAFIVPPKGQTLSAIYAESPSAQAPADKSKVAAK
jgi:hypothetical protein